MRFSRFCTLLCSGAALMSVQPARAQVNDRLEVTTYEASTEAEVADMAAAIRAQFLELKAAHPELQRPEVLILDPTDPRAQALDDAQGAQAASAGGNTTVAGTGNRATGALAKDRLLRLKAGVARGTVSGGAAFFNLILLSDVHLLRLLGGHHQLLRETSMPERLKVVVPMALLSGAAGYFYDEISAVINNTNSRVGVFLRLWAIEGTFTVAANAGMVWAGLTDPSLGKFLASTALISVVSTATQGIWEAAITQERLALLAQAPEEEHYDIRRVNNYKTIGIAIAAISLNLVSSLELPHAKLALGGLGAVGYAYLKYIERRFSCERALTGVPEAA